MNPCTVTPYSGSVYAMAYFRPPRNPNPSALEGIEEESVSVKAIIAASVTMRFMTMNWQLFVSLRILLICFIPFTGVPLKVEPPANQTN